MFNRLFFLSLLVLAFDRTSSAEQSADYRPVSLRCEYLTNPVGIDTPRPRLFWNIQDERRGSVQSAYQVLVATRPELLEPGQSDVWESSRMETSQTAHIVYDGPPLRSATRYHWKVRSWDKDGRPSDSTEPAFWETALLRPEDWRARMIGWHQNAPETTVSLEGAWWIWTSEGDPLRNSPNGIRYFRTRFDVEAGRGAVDKAELILLMDSNGYAHVNGARVATQTGYRLTKPADITDQIVAGNNVLAVAVNNSDDGPAGLLALITVQYRDGTVQRVASGKGWKENNRKPDGWDRSDFSEESWKPVRVLAQAGEGPWGAPSLVQPGDPPAMLRKAFTVEKPVRQARLYVTALGSYRPHLNGARVGQDLLTPDWTDYNKRLSYQTYDVTDMVKTGRNAIGALVGSGWYNTPLGWQYVRGWYGEAPPRLLMQLALEHEDGTTAVVVTDESWRASDGAVRRSEIYDGELYDARLEKAGWDTAEYDDSAWETVNRVGATSVPLTAQSSPQIRFTETLKPVEITSPAPGIHVFDLGQNMVGYARLKVRGPAGTTVTMRFAEILKPDGRVYRENLRRAEATDTYILKGDGEEIYEPHFTYHGFRYVEVLGYPGQPAADAIEGLVFHTDVEPAGRFWSSSELVNRVERNTLWGLRGNLHSIPTDCPQRDERLGWLGDAQVIWPTGCFSYDLASFTVKFTRDMVEAQSPEGGFPNVAPRVVSMNNGAPGWGDAGIIIPYTAWRMYGDRRLLEDNWDAMRDWMRYIHEANPDLLWTERRYSDYGDWVPAGGPSPKDVIATAYWAYDARLMAEMARALGRANEARNYERLHDTIGKAFTTAFVSEDGRVSSRTQTCQILALHMDAVPDELRPAVAAQLRDEITSSNHHLTTGFLGTAYLMPVLSENGMNDVAYRLLLNETFPSWGYMVKKGATTIWERWNSDTGDPGMNSFNHYCYGAVVEWLYRYAAGIDTAKHVPAFKEFVIRPQVAAGLNEVRGEYRSLHGTIVSEWKREGDLLTLNVTVPPNTRARVYVPTTDAGAIRESGKAPADAEGVEPAEAGNGVAIYAVGSGRYRFTSPLKGQ